MVVATWPYATVFAPEYECVLLYSAVYGVQFLFFAQQVVSVARQKRKENEATY